LLQHCHSVTAAFSEY